MSFDKIKGMFAGLVFVSLIFAALGLTISSFNEQLVTDLSVSSATNESVTLSNGVAVALAHNWHASTVRVLSDDNSTNLANGVNYTITNSGTEKGATITLNTADYDGNVSYVTYTYHDDESTVYTNTSREGGVGLMNATSYLSTIGTLIGISAIIFVIVGAMYFVFRR